MKTALEKIQAGDLKEDLPVAVRNFYDAPGGSGPGDLAGASRLAGALRGGIAGLASGLHYATGGMVPVDKDARYSQTVAQRTSATAPPFAMGGLVPVRLEPGERVYESPLSRQQTSALMAVNTAFPRQGGRSSWTVPGYGSGDQVPAWVPSGSFVLNRRAAGAMGYQAGGPTGGTGRRHAMAPPVLMRLSLKSSISTWIFAALGFRAALKMRRKSSAILKTWQRRTRCIRVCNQLVQPVRQAHTK